MSSRLEKLERNSSIEIYEFRRMNERCPRTKDTENPITLHKQVGLCSKALEKINAIRQFIQENNRHPTEQEEMDMAGCKYFINDHKSGYCSFVHLAKIGRNDILLKHEVASLIMVDSTETAKIEANLLKELRDDFNREDIPEPKSHEEYLMHNEDIFSGAGADDNANPNSSDDVPDDF